MGRPKEGYRLASGAVVPSVTTVISKFQDPGALMWWSYQEGRAGRDYRDSRQRAADAGTAAHAMVECDIRGHEFDRNLYPPEVLAKADRAFEAYREWKEQTRLTPVETEVSLVSEKYRFGGTMDCVLIGGRRCVGDWKTSNAVYSSMLLQIAAYGLLWEEHHPDELIEGFHLMRFSKGEHVDFAQHFFADLTDARKGFLLMRELYDIDAKLRQRVK